MSAEDGMDPPGPALTGVPPTPPSRRFEEHAVGGRAYSLEVEGQTVELGASIIHAENALVSRLAAEVGLEKEAPPSGRFALYDGRTLIFRESSWWILNVLQLFWRYGFTAFTFRRCVCFLLAWPPALVCSCAEAGA